MSRIPGTGRNALRSIAGRVYPVFTPVFLLALVVVGVLGFQTTILMAEQAQLQQRYQNLEEKFARAQEVRGQFESIAREIQELAEKGNPNARRLAAELEKRGIGNQLSGASQGAASSGS